MSFRVVVWPNNAADAGKMVPLFYFKHHPTNSKIMRMPQLDSKKLPSEYFNEL